MQNKDELDEEGLDEDGKWLWRAIKRSSSRLAKKERGWGEQALRAIGDGGESKREENITASDNLDTPTSKTTDASTTAKAGLATTASYGETQPLEAKSLGAKHLGIKQLQSKHLQTADLGSQRRVGGLHGRLAQRLRRGTIPIELRIDLHGMTRAAAAAVLRTRIPQSYASGSRCLLVITGKGRGLLRDDLPMLLSSDGLRELVLGHCLARDKDGGEGARYVLLRRKR